MIIIFVVVGCKDWSKERVKNALVKYKQRVEEYWQKLTTLNDQVSVMENELYVLKTSTQEGFGALERDTQETVKSAVADMKDMLMSYRASMRPVLKKSWILRELYDTTRNSQVSGC